MALKAAGALDVSHFASIAAIFSGYTLKASTPFTSPKIIATKHVIKPKSKPIAIDLLANATSRPLIK